MLKRTVANSGIFLYSKQSYRWKSGQQNHKASSLTVSQSVSASTRWLRKRLHFVCWQILRGSSTFMCVGYCWKERIKTTSQMGSEFLTTDYLLKKRVSVTHWIEFLKKFLIGEYQNELLCICSSIWGPAIICVYLLLLSWFTQKVLLWRSAKKYFLQC